MRALSHRFPRAAFLGLAALPAALLLAACRAALPVSSAAPAMALVTFTLAPTWPPPKSEPTALPATPTLPPPTAPALGASRVAPVDDMPQRYVPAGPFQMGAAAAEPGADAYEQPTHTVNLDAFWVDQTEVTNAQFARFVAATGYRTQAEAAGQGTVWVQSQAAWQALAGADWQHPRGPKSTLDSLDQHPVVQVSWSDAQAYCRWAGRRLPTEAEWEKAARGTDGRRYPWGQSAEGGPYANFADARLAAPWANTAVDDGYAFTAPVGSYPAGASPYGALDMAGNVWEWVTDWFSEFYYVHSAASHPAGPAIGYLKVVRGGGWFDQLSELTTFNRSTLRLSPLPWSDFTGFRCVSGPALPAAPTAPAPVVATLSPADPSAYLTLYAAHARQIFAQGRRQGLSAHTFALVGDSNTDNPAFLAPLDRGDYTLGDYAALEDTIQYYRGAFAQHSPAAVGSFRTAWVLDPAHADNRCRPGETPLLCEYRLQQPAAALILIGTGDHQAWQTFEVRYRQIITLTVSADILPVLITKADDMESVYGDAPIGFINDVIRRLSAEYQIPLLDLRRVVDGLPNHGCGADGFHYNLPPDGRAADFTGDHLTYGYPVRNLTALQVLDALRREVYTRP